MSDEAMLAQLMRQAGQEGAALVTLRALAEEASEVGVARALAQLGLADTKARRDMDELRELLQAWRDAKKSAWNGVTAWVVRILLALLVPAIISNGAWGSWGWRCIARRSASPWAAVPKRKAPMSGH